MSCPKVSIGLPVYNGQRYLEQALRSLVGQSFTDFELIISDNCSTDNTADICQSFASRDARVRYGRNDRNVGANPNFNRVLELAQGKYFRWAAYDDICQPDYLAACVAALDADPSAVLAHTQTTVIDDLGRAIDPDTGWQTGELADPSRKLASPSPVKRFAEILIRSKWCFEIFGLMRTDLLRQTGGHGSFYGSDKVILSTLCLQGTFVEDPRPLFWRRHHGGQSSSMASAVQRAAWSGVARPRQPLQSQLNCLAGYSRAIRRSKLSLAQRLACRAIVGRYLLQPTKWASAIGWHHRPRSVDAAHEQPTFVTK